MNGRAARRSADSSYSDSSHVPVVAGRSVRGWLMPRGGHENEAKRRGQRATTRRGGGRERERRGERRRTAFAGTVQRRSTEGEERPREAKGWWVNSGEILLVSSKGWSTVCAGQLASARRFNRVRVALPKNGGGGK